MSEKTNDNEINASLQEALRQRASLGWAGRLVRNSNGSWEERFDVPPKGTAFVEVFRSGEAREYLNDGTGAFMRLA